MTYGPAYPKINTVFKRDDKNRIIVGQYSQPEFAYLRNNEWLWTEKVDGTNIRLHWDGEKVTIGGRTDNANLPQQLVTNLQPLVTDTALWASVFPDSPDVTVYGEGYGAKIQSGGYYRPDQQLIVFDVRVGRWWLRYGDVEKVAKDLGLETVPFYMIDTLETATTMTANGALKSDWPNAPIEGLVGIPLVGLHDRTGQRIMAKLKVKDFANVSPEGLE